LLIKGAGGMNGKQRTAYILQIHKNADQVNRFIHQLIAEDRADVFVHIDKKNYEDLSERIIQSPRVKVLQQSISCNWGDRSQVDTTILLLREVVSSNHKYDYVSLRSGQDLLIRSGLAEFLEENNGKIFLDLRNITKKNLCVMKINWPSITRKRYTSAHPYRILRRLLQDLYDKGINPFPNKNYWPEDFAFYCGSQWFTIPLEVAKYILEFLEENVWYYRFFEKTYIPDEWFFHTIIMNSPYKHQVINNNLTYLRIGEKLTERNSPVNLTSQEIPLLEKSSQFFARKFDETTDSAVIDYFVNKVSFGRKTFVSSRV